MFEILEGDVRCSNTWKALKRPSKPSSESLSDLDRKTAKKNKFAGVIVFYIDLTQKTAKWAYNEKIPGGFHAVRYQFYKATRRNQYKQLSSASNYRPRMLWVLQQRGIKDGT